MRNVYIVDLEGEDDDGYGATAIIGICSSLKHAERLMLEAIKANGYMDPVVSKENYEISLVKQNCSFFDGQACKQMSRYSLTGNRLKHNGTQGHIPELQ